MSNNNLFFGKRFYTSDVDATAFIDVVTGLTLSQENAIYNLVGSLKANGTWDKYHAIYPMIGGTADSHKWNLKDPRDLDVAYRLTWNGNWTHDENGAKGDGSTAWAQTWFYNTAFTTKTSTTQDFSIGYYSNLQINGASQQDTEMGSYNGASRGSLILQIWETTIDNFFGSGFNAGWLEYAHTYASLGFTKLNGLSGTVRCYKNTTQIGTDATQTNSLPSDVPLAINTIGNSANGLTDLSSTNRSTRRTAFCYIADGFTETELNNDHITIQAYQTALSRQV